MNNRTTPFVRRRTLSLLIAALATPSIAAPHLQNPVIVTATRTAQTLSTSLAPATVITQEDIERLRPRDVIELLKYVPGVDTTQRGGAGADSSTFIRGTNSNHLLVLVDGQRVGSATSGGTSLQYVDPSQIERIEIVRGPLSSLYGSDAIGGVIQIITKKGSKAHPVTLHAAAGSNQTREAAINASADIAGWNSSVGVSHYNTEGYNRTFSETGGSEDDDAYRNSTVNVSSQRTLGAGAVNLQYLRNEAESEYDAISYCSNASGVCMPYSEIVNESGSVGGSYAFSDEFKLSSSIGSAKDVTTAKDDANAAVNDSFTTWRNSFLLQGDWQLDQNAVFTAGFDYTRDRVRGAIVGYDPVTYEPLPATNYDKTTRGNRAWFAQLQNRIGKADFLFGFRNDDNDAFGRETTGNFSLGINATQSTRVIWSSGSAFHAPTFNDLYWPDPSGPGNPDLLPEQSISHELRIEQRTQDAVYSASLYQTEITDLIQWQPTDPADDYSPWTPVNVADADIQGAELGATICLEDYIIQGSYSYTRPRNAETDTQLINRSRQKLTVSVDRKFGAFGIGIDATAYSKRYMDQDNITSTGGYGLIDLRLSYDVMRNLTTALKVGNALDRDYVVVDRYREDRVNAMFSVDYKL